MLLIVGLGNPGSKYALNRHNVGYMAVDFLEKNLNSSGFKDVKKKSLLSLCEVEGNKVFLLKPLTYMNLSGESVGYISNFFKIPRDKIVVIHDDLDLPFGIVKKKFGGGSGGHNGLKSISQHISDKFWRVRIGIGRPEYKSDVTPYVLGDFASDELEVVKNICKNLVESFDEWFKEIAG